MRVYWGVFAIVLCATSAAASSEREAILDAFQNVCLQRTWPKLLAAMEKTAAARGWHRGSSNERSSSLVKTLIWNIPIEGTSVARILATDLGACTVSAKPYSDQLLANHFADALGLGEPNQVAVDEGRKSFEWNRPKKFPYLRLSYNERHGKDGIETSLEAYVSFLQPGRH